MALEHGGGLEADLKYQFVAGLEMLLKIQAAKVDSRVREAALAAFAKLSVEEQAEHTADLVHLLERKPNDEHLVEAYGATGLHSIELLLYHIRSFYLSTRCPPLPASLPPSLLPWSRFTSPFLGLASSLC